MKEFDITVAFDVGENTLSLDEIDDRLFEGGFDDALISHSGARFIKVELQRRATSERELIEEIVGKVREYCQNPSI